MTDPSSQLATTTTAASDDAMRVFSGIAAFDAAQRMAKALSSSTLVPQIYRGQEGLANSLIALEMAGRMGLSPLIVMQNLHPMHGRPSWSSQFLIATVNASGRFSPLRFSFDDEDNPTACHAHATDKESGELLKGPKITIAMAKSEGWWSRKDKNGRETSKWQTMPELLLRYRAAAFWVRLYCPEISLGLVTQEEATDIEAVTVAEVAPPAPALAPEPEQPVEVAEAVYAVEPEPEPEAPAPAEPDPLARGLESIAGMTTVADLDRAVQRVAQLLQEGGIDKAGAAELRAAIRARAAELPT
jgi:hypothetical protein